MTEQDEQDGAEDTPDRWAHEQVGNNPAYLLAGYLDRWQVPANTASEQPRGFPAGDFSDVHQWQVHTLCMDLVRQVDELVTGLASDGVDVEMYVDAIPDWYAGTYAATVPFQSTTSQARQIISRIEINHLRGLGALIEARVSLQTTRGDVAELKSALGRVRTILVDDSADIPQDIRVYLFGLVNRAQAVLDSLAEAGPTAARSVMIELSGALRLRADVDETQRPDRAEKFKTLAKAVVTPFATGAGAETAKAVGRYVKGAIESGGLG